MKDLTRILEQVRSFNGHEIQTSMINKPYDQRAITYVPPTSAIDCNFGNECVDYECVDNSARNTTQMYNECWSGDCDCVDCGDNSDCQCTDDNCDNC